MVGINGSSSATSWIPVVDLSPFSAENNLDEIGNKKKMQAVLDVVKEACSETGFFQVVNHGVPTQLMDQAFQVSTQFFNSPDDEKLNYSSGPDASFAPGYSLRPFHPPHRSESLLLFPPSSPFNVYPANPPNLREVVVDVFTSLRKTGSLIEGIINDSLGLPSGVLKEFNDDRNMDFMLAHRYFPATKNDTKGLTPHEDANPVTMIFQDAVGGLEILKDGEWIPATPEPGAIVVNVGDIIQVFSNNKFKSATHRVVGPTGKSRYSYAFFYNLSLEKWVEPLPQFTEEIGELPKYRKFQYGEYLELKRKDVLSTSQKAEDIVHVTHYSIK